MNELRYAVRRLAASPGFFLTALTTLALGVGATTLMFSAVQGLLVRPLPYVAADRLGWIMAQPAQGDPEGLSSDEARAVAARASAFEAIAVIGDMGLVREVGPRHDRWRGIWTTRGLANVLGVTLAAGAVPARIDPEGPRQILIAEERWRQDLSGDLSVLGQEIAFADNKRFVIAGVLPRGLEFPFARAPHRGNGAGFVPGRQDFWVLQADDSAGLPGGFAVARFRSKLSVTQVSAQVAAVSSALAAAAGDAVMPARALTFIPLREQVLGGLRRALGVLQAFAILVFLIACGNLGTLLLARAVSRRDEIAIRVALGARPAALTRTFAADALVLCVSAAAVGLLVCAVGRALIVRLAPRHEALVARITFDWTTVAFASALAVITTIVFGILPGWLRARGAVADAPRVSARTTGGGVQMAFGGLVMAQIALSLALLVGAVALRDSFHRIMGVDAGYQMRGVVAADMLLYVPMKEALPLIDGLVTRLRATPGITAVGLVHSTPLTAKWTIRDAIELLDGPRAGEAPSISGGFVAYDYFKAMGVPLLAGREFTRAEFTGSRQRVIIVNDVVARTFFAGVDPVGARVRMNGATHQIVGVVKGTRDARLDAAAEPQWYQPAVLGSSQVIVRGSGAAAVTVDIVQRALRDTDPRLIIERIDPLERIASDSVIERRLAAQLVSAFAVVAMALAGIGLYGVVHFASTRRAREFGIRMAIGARPVQILSMVLRQGIQMAGSGVAVGVAISVAAADGLQSHLFESRAADPLVIMVASLALVAIAAIASLRPAWRSASLDPMATLRRE
jgi:predicted permease